MQAAKRFKLTMKEEPPPSRVAVREVDEDYVGGDAVSDEEDPDAYARGDSDEDFEMSDDDAPFRSRKRSRAADKPATPMKSKSKGKGKGKGKGKAVGVGKAASPAASAAPRSQTHAFGGDLEDEDEGRGFQDFSKSLTLKRDHVNRPIWITQDCVIYLEAFSIYYQQAYDFLVAVAEPVARPKLIHTYRLTENSLYAAVALSIDTATIIKTLNRLCKTDMPPTVARFIRDGTYTFGKAKLVLKENKFFVESQFPEVLRELLKNPTIKNARITEADGPQEGFIEGAAPQEDKGGLQYLLEMDPDDDDDDDDEGGGFGLAGGGGKRTVSFMIAQQLVQSVKKSAKEDSKYPLMEEYDFKNDTKNPLLMMDLRPSTKIRPYQEKSLTKMFGNGRARSGIIVLPCGAGKSLTGVTAASTVKRSTVVVCINNASVIQWRNEFLRWTNLSAVYEPSHPVIKIFTSHKKDPLPHKKDACIVITTYSMLCHGGHRSASGEMMIKSIKEREWGLMILDEVHVAPAEQFQRVLQIVNTHCKLGLTATLVREDNKIKDLNFLVGPKLYEANWIDLTEQGYLARVKCVEVWCPMTKEFYAEYVKCSGGSFGSQNARLQRLLYNLNPCKFRTCEFLVKFHAARGDKIIIFSDDLPALVLYCSCLKTVQDIPYINGATPHADRENILKLFKQRSNICPCIGLSKVGDTALDIPEANVIIQVSSHFGARRQEAQRLGRILRPKSNPQGGFNAFFYTLVSTDTREMYFSTKRQQYLIDQGYTFSVVQDLAERADKDSIILKTKSDELGLLTQVLKFNYAEHDSKEERSGQREANNEEDEDDPEYVPPPSDATGPASAVPAAPVVQRKTSSLGARSGGEGLVYSEFNS